MAAGRRAWARTPKLAALPALGGLVLAHAAMVGVAGCGSRDVAVTLPEKPLLEEVSVPVVQALAARPYRFGWLDEERVVMFDLERIVVWEPATDRVLLNEPTNELSRVEVTAGLPPGSIRLPPLLALENDSGAVMRTPSGTTAHIDVLSSPARLVIEDDGVERLALPVGGDSVAFAPDVGHAVVCHAGEVSLVDLAAATVVATTRREDVRGCAFEGGNVALVGEGDVTLLDGTTLAPIGLPITDATLGAPGNEGADIAIVLDGSREGVSVIDVTTRTERFHRSMPAPSVLRLVDGVLFAGTDESGAFYDVTSRRTLVEHDLGVQAVHLGTRGRVLALDGDTVVVRHRDGSVTRSGLPVRANLRVDSHRGLAIDVGDRAFFLDEHFEPHELGRCHALLTDVLAMGRAAPSNVGRFGARLHRVGFGCVAHEDGTSAMGTFDPIGVGEDGTFVAQSGGRVEIHAPDGSVRAVLALDPGEDPPCRVAMCGIPVAISRDGRYVVMARGPRLRVFDGSTGAKLAERAVLARTRLLEIGDDGIVLHEARGPVGSMGVRWEIERRILTLPALEERASWRPVEPDLFTHEGTLWARIGDVTIEAVGTALVVRDLDGHITRSIDRAVSGIGVPTDVVVAMAPEGETPPTVLSWPSLDVIGTVPGWVAHAGGHTIVSCSDHSAHHTRVSDAGLDTRDLGIPCATAAALGASPTSPVVIAADYDVALVRDDHRHAAVVVTFDGERLAVSGIVPGDDGATVHGPALVALRAETLTSRGMRVLPSEPTSLASWWAAGR